MRLHNASVPSVLLALCICILTTGCSMKTPLLTEETLSQRVNGLLSGQDAVSVQAGRLTDFSWQELCFRRDDVLRLEFQIGDTLHPVPLSYEAFFVDEGHVADSLEDACVTPSDLVVVRRKYPGYAAPVAFQSAQTSNGE